MDRGPLLRATAPDSWLTAAELIRGGDITSSVPVDGHREELRRLRTELAVLRHDLAVQQVGWASLRADWVGFEDRRAELVRELSVNQRALRTRYDALRQRYLAVRRSQGCSVPVTPCRVAECYSGESMDRGPVARKHWSSLG